MSSQTQYAIQTESLTKIYDGRHIALQCVDLAVERGTVLGVLGNNGAGKTTLMKLLMGLHVPTAGRVLMLGQRMTPNAAPLRRRIGYLSSDPKFPTKMTPIDYLDMVGQLAGLSYKVRRPRLASLLNAVDLLKQAGNSIDKFSTGMKTRLAIAASLINDPEILLWDEPAQGLDADARRSMITLMQNLAEHKTLVLCSHQLSEVREVCDQAIVLAEGQVLFNGPIEQLKSTSKPSIVSIALQGEKKGIAESMKSIQSFDELESCELNKNLLTLVIRSDSSHATALANVLVTLADHKLEMTDLKISGQDMDQAIQHLMSEEASRGLTRAYQSK